MREANFKRKNRTNQSFNPELFSRPAFGLFDEQGYGFINSFYEMMQDI